MRQTTRLCCAALKDTAHLLIGGIGSGKTTQLMMARDRINEIGDTHAIYVDASLYTDISEIQPGDLIAIFGLVLSDIIQDQESYFFKRQLYGYIEQKETIHHGNCIYS